jgi:hypothetical protein
MLYHINIMMILSFNMVELIMQGFLSYQNKNHAKDSFVYNCIALDWRFQFSMSYAFSKSLITNSHIRHIGKHWIKIR